MNHRVFISGCLLRSLDLVVVVFLRTKCVCVCLLCRRKTFGQTADTHVDLMNQAEQAVLDGTSKWSCKIAITGERVKAHGFLIRVVLPL